MIPSKQKYFILKSSCFSHLNCYRRIYNVADIILKRKFWKWSDWKQSESSLFFFKPADIPPSMDTILTARSPRLNQQMELPQNKSHNPGRTVRPPFLWASMKQCRTHFLKELWVLSTRKRHLLSAPAPTVNCTHKNSLVFLCLKEPPPCKFLWNGPALSSSSPMKPANITWRRALYSTLKTEWQ